jgi:pSer/pThr/pTyr-binding forkhead associated (FHA) protein
MRPESSAAIVCRSCGTNNPEGGSFCCECGAPLAAREKARPLGGTMVAAGGAVVPGSQAPGVPRPNASRVPEIDASGSLRGGLGLAPHPVMQGALHAEVAPAEQERPSGVAPKSLPASLPGPATERPFGDFGAAPASVPASGMRPPDGRGALRAVPPLRTCPRCEGANSPEARFCQLCGLALGEPEPSPELPPRTGGVGSVPRLDAHLVVIGQDGTPGRRYPLVGATIDVGRESGDILLERDPFVCPRHARITYGSGGYSIEDLGSVNGVYVRLGTSPVELRHGDLLLLGQAVLRFEIVEETERSISPAVRDSTRVFGTPAFARRARLVVHTVEGCGRDIFYLSRPETILGREAGDIVFTDDPFMSRRHGALRRASATNTYTLRDLGSSNGTFIAIRRKQPLSPGDHVRIGQHLFRLDVQSGGSS